MKIVVGLGNPGEQYARTRHNIGFRIVDRLAEKTGAAAFADTRQQALCATCRVAGEPVLLVKPTTFMNRSGDALTAILDEQEEEPAGEDLLIIADDVALPLGRMRFRERGSCGGHNGLASIETALATQDYARLRVGVGPAASDATVTGEELVDFVLGEFAREEETVLDKVIPAADEAARLWIAEGIDSCQQRYNGLNLGDATRRNEAAGARENDESETDKAH